MALKLKGPSPSTSKAKITAADTTTQDVSLLSFDKTRPQKTMFMKNLKNY